MNWFEKMHPEIDPLDTFYPEEKNDDDDDEEEEEEGAGAGAARRREGAVCVPPPFVPTVSLLPCSTRLFGFTLNYTSLRIILLKNAGLALW